MIVISYSTRLVDSANLIFGIYLTYDLVVTNFGDYQATVSSPWSRAALALSTGALAYRNQLMSAVFMHMKPVILESFVQHFYAYRIYCLGWRLPYLPIAISVSSLAEVAIGAVYSIHVLVIVALFFSFSQVLHIAFNTQAVASFRNGSFTATLSCKVLCDVLITVGMVYTLLRNRTQVRRTNDVLNLLAIYAINCGILHLMFAIACVVLFATYPNALIYTASFFIMVRLSLCAFMSILNSRDHLRETLDGPGGVVLVTLTKTTLPR
ncbi:hypothetical protein EDB86DRAFT_927607 [Lactarius hatsudake]|nr:hypothetical protein EDB86DRAFT_927607 [Lactarius hatsudake]